MKNSEYWAQRFTQLENAQNKQGSEALKKIEDLYRQAQKQLETQILVWYQRFAKNNGISLSEARQWLKDNDLKEFKWDVWDYIKYGQDNALSGNWIKELENASAKYHISRLEALKIHTQQSLESLFSKQGLIISNTMGDIYKSGYYHTAYELQKGFNIGWDIAGIDEKQLEKVLAKPWAVDGYNFSERIWNNKNKLIQDVHKEISQNIMLGADPQKAINNLAKKMNTSKYNAGRLVMTEEAYFSSLSQKEAFQELGVEQYEIVATLDSHTSEICRNLDGKHFPMTDYRAGETAPPFHVYCRSTTAPYFDDDFGIVGQRAARDEETGKTYYVPANMTYKEWENAFVKNGNKSGLTSLSKMSESSNVDWSSTKPIKHSKEAQKEIIEYAKSKNINVYAINKFDGNADILKEQIDVISETAKEYGINDKITITFNIFADDADFAQTTNNTITFNTKALRNREITNYILNEDDFLASTDIVGIAIHEMGHIISRKYGEKGIELAKETYYNIYRKEINTEELIEFLYKNISKYCVNKSNLTDFKAKNYKEIIPEILAKQETNPNRFTEEFMRLLKEVIL